MASDAKWIVERVLEIERERQKKGALRERRMNYACELWERCEADAPHDLPCWKPRPIGPEDYEPPPRSEWCPSCLERQATHDEYVKSRNRLGGLRAGLTRAAKAIVQVEEASDG